MILECATRQGRGAGRKKGAKHRGARTPHSGSAVRSPQLPEGVERAAKRVQSTEGRGHRAAVPQTRSPQLPEGVERAVKKGAKHRGRARRIAAAQSEARNSPKGWSGPLKIRPGRFFVPVRPPLTIPCLRREFNRRKRPARARRNRLSRNPTNELRKSKQSCIISLTCCA